MKLEHQDEPTVSQHNRLNGELNIKERELTYLIENLLCLLDFDMFNRVSCHPATATDPFQVSFVNVLRTDKTHVSVIQENNLLKLYTKHLHHFEDHKLCEPG